MGVPFPYVLRTGKARFTEATAALLFAINAAASALTVPLTLNLSTSVGFQGTLLVGLLIYAVVGVVLLALHKPALRQLANAMALVVLGGLLVCPWFLSEKASWAAHSPERNRVYALEYGQSRRSENRVMHRGSRSRRVRFGWHFWLIEGNGRRVLVDTGVGDRKLASDRGIRSWVPPVDRLRELGVTPSDIDDVILTHGHWDHIDDLAAYDTATVWMQERELLYMQSLVSSTVRERKGMRWGDLRLLESLAQEGRLKLVQGEQNIAPGIDVVPGPGHTPGSQWVKVETVDGTVVLAADSTYLYLNNQWHVPVASAADRKDNLATIEAMHRAAASPFFIIPGHDPRVMSDFPEVADGVVEIAAVAD
jgi:glyoxylase-like metal-dependent hydrolase (beta-lactamase superfamily II)